MKNRIMQYSGRTASVLLMLVLTVSSQAQLVSSEYDFSSMTGNRVIVRSMNNGDILMYNENLYDDGSYFTYRKPASSTGSQLKLIPPLNVNGTARYKINDMCAIGDMCYFCGQLLEPTDPSLPPVVPDNDSRDGISYTGSGIIGRFKMVSSHPFILSPCVYATMAVGNTYSLNRMDFIVDGTDTVLAMVGLLSSDTTQTCIVACQTSPLAGARQLIAPLLLT